jgi:hypothetical protein
MKFTLMIQTSFAILRLLFHKISTIFNTLLPTMCKMLYTNVIKLPSSTLEHIMKTVTIHCHLQNGIHVVHSLQGKIGGTHITIKTTKQTESHSLTKKLNYIVI